MPIAEALNAVSRKSTPETRRKAEEAAAVMDNPKAPEDARLEAAATLLEIVPVPAAAEPMANRSEILKWPPEKIVAYFDGVAEDNKRLSLEVKRLTSENERLKKRLNGECKN